MLPAIAVLPTDPALMDLGGLFAPTAILAAVAVLLTLGVVVAALIAERRDRAGLDRLAKSGSVSRLERAPRRAAA